MLGLALAGLMLLAPASGQTLTLTVVTTVTVSTDVPIPYGVRPYSKIEGKGILLKKGGGTLNLIDVVNSSEGTIRLQEGGLFIQKDEALGHNEAILHFLGGTLSFLAFGAPITLGGTRHIILENSGTFFAPFGGFATVHVHSKLSGSGELRKLGINDLNFEQIDAGKFTGTIRLEEGGLVIGADNNLGSTVDGSALVFSGGTVHFSVPSGPSISIVLGKNRLITIEAGAKGNFNTRGGTVAVRSTLSGSGELRKTGAGLLDFRGIQASLFAGTVRLEAGGLLIDEGRDLGSMSSMVFSGGTLSFDGVSTVSLTASQIAIETSGTFDARTDAAISSTLSGSGELRKTGAGLLDFRGIQASLFAGTVRLEAGGLLIDEGRDLGSMSSMVFSGGTLSFDGVSTVSLTASQIAIETSGTFDARTDAAISSTLSGSGELRKTGAGLLDFRGIQASLFAGTVRLEAGGLLIDEGRDLGSMSSMVFSGGTLSFDGVSTVSLTASQITIETSGTFDARTEVAVSSTLSGSGELRKTGAGLLDFRGIQASLFAGTVRLEAGGLLIDEGRDLGSMSSMVFSGGTLSFDGVSTVSLTASQITIETSGTFDARTDAAISSTLYGSGEFKKIGAGQLDVSNLSARMFTGTIRIEEGALFVNKHWTAFFEHVSSNKPKSLVFAGGTMRTQDSRSTFRGGKIIIETSGNADIKDHFNADMSFRNSTLSGPGILRKTGEASLWLRNIQAATFEGTLRVESGFFGFSGDNNVWNKKAKLVLAGGTFWPNKNMKAPDIIVEKNVTINGNNGAIESAISVANSATLNIKKGLAITGRRNHINNIVIGQGNTTINSDSLGRTGKKQVYINIEGAYWQEGSKIFHIGTTVSFHQKEGEDGVIEDWHIGGRTYVYGRRAHINKIGAGKLTIERGKFEHPFHFNILEGSWISKDTSYLANIQMRVYNSATLVFDSAADTSRSPIHVYGEGSFVKKGSGKLGIFFGLHREFPHLDIQEGVLSVETFSGANVTLTNALKGSGELKKTGYGNLDFRSIADASKFRGTIRLEAGDLLIDEGKNLGLASGLAFSGGTLRLATHSTVAIALAQSVTVSADSGHKAFIAFSTTVELKKAFVDRVAKEATVQMIFQGSNARLTLGVDSDISITLRNWIFQGGETPVIDVGTAMPSTSGMSMGARMTDKLTMKEAGFIGTSPSATVTMGTININRQVGIYSKVKTLDLRGWAVSITGKRRFMLSLASIPLTVSTGIKHHFGPRSLSGQGFVSKKGEGYLDMSHTDGSGFGGTVNIFGGTLKTGSLGKKSKMNVHSGATVQGGGKVGSVEVLDGGTLHHSSSVTLHVQGDYTQAGGTHRVHLRRNFAAITVDGTASLLKGTVTITAVEQIEMDDIYYLIHASSITMAGPVKTTITLSEPVTVTSVVTLTVGPFLITSTITATSTASISVYRPFTLANDSNVFAMITLLPVTHKHKLAIEYKLKSNPMYYRYVRGSNGRQMALALSQIDSRNPGEPANYALLHINSADQARRMLSSLSGEMHVSAASARMSSGALMEDAALGQMRMAFGRKVNSSQHALRATVPAAAFGLADKARIGGGLGIWAKSLSFEMRYGGAEGISALSYSSSGSLLGFDLPVGDWRAGLFSGTSKARFFQDAGQSAGTDDSYHAGMYAGRVWGRTALQAGVSYSDHEISMARRLHLPGTGNRLSSRYRAHTYAFFGQLDRRLALAGVVLEPFVGLSHVRHSTEAFEEKGVAGLAIRSAGQQDIASIASAGMGVSGGFQLGSVRMQARGVLSWKRRLGGGSEAVGRQSLGSSDSFDVYGAGSELDSLEVDAGLDVRLGRGVDMSFAYSETDLLDAGGRDGYFRAALVIE